MNKKERKASQAKPKFTPLPTTYNQDYFDYKIVDACIVKEKKGDWRVVFRFDGEHTYRDKKCKSKTQAEEWVAKHSK